MSTLVSFVMGHFLPWIATSIFLFFLVIFFFDGTLDEQNNMITTVTNTVKITQPSTNPLRNKKLSSFEAALEGSKGSPRQQRHILMDSHKN